MAIGNPSIWRCAERLRNNNSRHRHAEVTGSNPVEALIFFWLFPSNCLNWKNYGNDHSSLSSTTAVQHEFHIYISQNLYDHIPLGHCAWLKSSPNDTIHLKWDGQFSISVDPPFCQWLASDSIVLASIQALQYCTCNWGTA